MTSVSVSALGEDYTWLNADSSWSDPIIGERPIGDFQFYLYGAEIQEELALIGEHARAYQLIADEAFSLTDSKALGISKGLYTSLTIGEELGRTADFRRTFAEDLTLTELYGNVVSLSFDEYFDLEDERPVFSATKAHHERLSFEESLSRTVKFHLYIAESLGIADLLGNRVELQFAEHFELYDVLSRDANLVISDMMISTLPMTPKLFDEFMAYGNVPGYARWRDFIPGDYEYREAMFRAVLTSKNSDRGLLQTAQVTVDVPDLIDRGIATVVNAEVGVRVNFSRRFHIIPEITVATRGGHGDLTITPKIIGSPDLQGFTAILQDSNNNKVTGTFSWAAHGY